MDTEKLIPECKIRGEDAKETRELEAMLQEAKDYIGSFSWAPIVTEAYMGIGIGGVLGVYLLRFSEGIGGGGDEYLWVITGDLPSAYLVTDEAATALEALGVYCDLMTDWAMAVKQGRSLSDVFPVDAVADREHAGMLLNRVKCIYERIIPDLST